MRSVLSLIAIAVIATATTEIRQSDEHDYFQPNSYPYHNLASVDPRQEMMTFSLIFPVRQTRPTIMEFTTSTSTIVCTKYVDTPCSLRTSTVERPERPSRRPAWFIRRGRPLPVYPETMENERDADILMDEDMEQQFTIFPTAVQRVESTRLPRLPSRENRAADPQLVFMYGNRPQDIESGFRSGPYKPVSLPFTRRYVQSAAPHNRQFFQNYWTLTRRATVMEITVSTSTPVCSKAGNIPQCAIEELDRKCPN
ncbi:Uncharacterized protein APZ42_018851 [Daphnia magna]|uniref:Uncharacterized protein n=2 Tax=Daphnia magna TaxID=35525 RepID=A0A164YUT3_9CRUS|nr:hypothetical protein OUZ56_002544 [Daphnia magna]KZS15630.1 Uncharacterized protein APZ42_018851 [Daphnia magna]